MTVKTINVAKEFHRSPAGRFYEDGSFSGQKFREEFLLPALQDKQFDKVEIILDNLEGEGSSFLEEAFGGLIRENKISYEVIKNKMILICKDDDTLVPRINSYLVGANKRK